MDRHFWVLLMPAKAIYGLWWGAYRFPGGLDKKWLIPLHPNRWWLYLISVIVIEPVLLKRSTLSSSTPSRSSEFADPGFFSKWPEGSGLTIQHPHCLFQRTLQQRERSFQKNLTLSPPFSPLSFCRPFWLGSESAVLAWAVLTWGKPRLQRADKAGGMNWSARKVWAEAVPAFCYKRNGKGREFSPTVGCGRVDRIVDKTPWPLWFCSVQLFESFTILLLKQEWFLLNCLRPGSKVS